MATDLQRPSIHTIPALDPAQETALFGYHIPYLPDFLADHTLLAERPLEQLQEVYGRLARFVTGLRKWRDSAFALRYLSRPEQGRVDLALVGRVTAVKPRAAHLAGQVAADLAVHLASYGLPVVPLTADNDTGPASLRRCLFPFSGPSVIVEVRQQEAIVPLLTVQQEAYVIYPFWRPATPFLEPFETLLLQPTMAVINLYLEPTDLSDAEMEALFTAAHIAESVADLERRVYSEASARRLRDPGAELVGRLYSAYRKTLDEPFILVAQVASTDANTAWTVARSLGAGISAGHDDSSDNDQERALPGQAQTIAPQNDTELAAARRTFTTLVHSPWGHSIATPGKERFPYLVGRGGLRLLFAFPSAPAAACPALPSNNAHPILKQGRASQKRPPMNCIWATTGAAAR